MGHMLGTWYDVSWMVLAAAALVLLLVALVRWGRDTTTAGLLTVVWLLVVLMVPLIGPAAYLLSRPMRRHDGQPVS